jgi:hypothetical protein
MLIRSTIEKMLGVPVTLDSNGGSAEASWRRGIVTLRKLTLGNPQTSKEYDCKYSLKADEVKVEIDQWRLFLSGWLNLRIKNITFKDITVNLQRLEGNDHLNLEVMLDSLYRRRKCRQTTVGTVKMVKIMEVNYYIQPGHKHSKCPNDPVTFSDFNREKGTELVQRLLDIACPEGTVLSGLLKGAQGMGQILISPVSHVKNAMENTRYRAESALEDTKESIILALDSVDEKVEKGKDMLYRHVQDIPLMAPLLEGDRSPDAIIAGSRVVVRPGASRMRGLVSIDEYDVGTILNHTDEDVTIKWEHTKEVSVVALPHFFEIFALEEDLIREASIVKEGPLHPSSCGCNDQNNAWNPLQWCLTKEAQKGQLTYHVV